jgi:hypothetical protein
MGNAAPSCSRIYFNARVLRGVTSKKYTADFNEIKSLALKTAAHGL